MQLVSCNVCASVYDVSKLRLWNSRYNNGATEEPFFTRAAHCKCGELLLTEHEIQDLLNKELKQ